jgi:hypothetical protein
MVLEETDIIPILEALGVLLDHPYPMLLASSGSNVL